MVILTIILRSIIYKPNMHLKKTYAHEYSM
jgi:hypothetical protein